MPKAILFLCLFAMDVFSNADLVAPFTVDVISKKNPLWDTIEVTTYVSNVGTTPTIVKTQDFNVVSVGIDSFIPLRLHNIPAGYYLDAGKTQVYKDTITAFFGPFAIVTQADPIHVFQESAIGNDLRSQAYNFYPKIVRDTILLVDTVKITIHDTIKVCPSYAKTSADPIVRQVPSTVYNTIGRPEWVGLLQEGAYPTDKLKQGLYIIVQGQKVRRFRVAYR